MPGRSSARSDQALAPIAALLADGDAAQARALLLPILQRRGGAGDHACALAARLLDTDSFCPDALAHALDRLLGVVEAQDAQLRALRSMLDERL